MEQDPDSPPTFWLQPPQTTTRHRKPPIDPVVLIILIPIIALIFLFFFLPPLLSHTSNILKPASVKSTWDSLNIFVVFFAILCGVLARRNDDVSSSNENSFVTTESSSSNNTSVDHSSGEWIGFSERKVVSGGLQRSCSSYPDLRQESLWEDLEIRNRFYDDSSSVSRYYNNLSRRIAAETKFSGDNFRRSESDLVEFSDVKEIVVDTFEVSQNSPVTPPPPPPPMHPPLSAKSKRNSFRSVGRKIESDEFEKVKTFTPQPAPPPPPPPPPPSKTEARIPKSRNKHTKLDRKVSDATKEIATAISSLYNQKKRKSKRKLINISSCSDSSPPSVHFGSPETEDLQRTVTRTPLPPPLPPPPPPTLFQNLFKKGGKHKRIHSVSPTVPPPPPPLPPSSIFNNIFKSGNKSKRFQSPPPPPPSSIMNNLFKTGTKSKRFNSSPPPPPPPPPPMTPPRYTKSEFRNRHSASNSKPPLPTKTSYYERDEFLPSGSQSPLIPMPPPPPPFRMSAMKFELRGDYVRIRSTHSSVCSSPDRDNSDLTTTVTDGGDIGPGSGSRAGPLYFPSPDVNAKADSFISRLKDEWRMEKINKMG